MIIGKLIDYYDGPQSGRLHCSLLEDPLFEPVEHAKGPERVEQVEAAPFFSFRHLWWVVPGCNKLSKNEYYKWDSQIKDDNNQLT